MYTFIQNPNMHSGKLYAPYVREPCDVIGTIVAQKMGIGFGLSRWGTPKSSPTEKILTLYPFSGN